MSHLFLKTSSVLLAILQITQAWTIDCYLNDLSNCKSVTYENAAELISTGYIDVSLPTKIFAHGMNGSNTTQGTDVIVQAYLNLGDRNVCIVNWEKEAKLLPVLSYATYPLIVTALTVIQKELAKGLQILYNNGMDPLKLHVLGLSLGAHLVGVAVKIFKELTGRLIARATGMDPAKPGFEGLIHAPRIDKSSALFVDIIHTDVNQFGIEEALGQIDFFPNIIEYRNTSLQPGCSPGFCSHGRALYLYAECIQYGGCQLLAVKAQSEPAWASGKVEDLVTTIGEETNQEYTGLFFLKTAGQPLYGLGEVGLTA